MFVGDFVGDVRRQNWAGLQDRVLEINVRNAAAFYSWITGRPFELPAEHSLAHLNAQFRQSNVSIREDRGFNRMQTLQHYIS